MSLTGKQAITSTEFTKTCSGWLTLGELLFIYFSSLAQSINRFYKKITLEIQISHLSKKNEVHK